MNKITEFSILRYYNTDLRNCQAKITNFSKKVRAMNYIYGIIEELCVKKGVNVTTVCRECKIPRSTITDYKKGRIKSLSVNTITKLADYFGVSMEYLCGSPITAANVEVLKAMIFGKGVVVTDDMWTELKEYAKFLKQKYSKNNN